VFGLPFAFIVSIAAIIIISLLVRRTALGVLTESVGINPSASRLAGVRSRGIVWSLYGLSGLLAGIAGILYSSNIMAADANNAGLNIELDAILAVVLGGTSLAGGNGSYFGTVAGAIFLTVLTALLTTLNVAPAERQVIFGVTLLVFMMVYGREAKLRG
jgi:galactofuranose transport system permease protein